MANEQLKQFYSTLDDSATLLKKRLHTSYLDALTESGENLATHTVQVEDGLPNAEDVAQLQAAYRTVDLDGLTADELRQALQLLLIKAIKEDEIEPNKQVTPDALASLVSFMVTAFYPQLPKTMTIADLAVGSGNLLYAVMNQLHAAAGTQVVGKGIDNDDTLLALAEMSRQLQRLDVALYHQDALATPPFSDADVVMADLPVGYYPVDERAKHFQTAAASGHSYAHHLLLEQSLKLLKPGGLGLFFVPSTVFQTTEAQGLTAWLSQAAYFQGLLTLPPSFFASAAAQKSLLVIQKPGVNAQQAKQVLLGAFPEVDDRQAFTQFIADVRQWTAHNLHVSD